MRLNYIDFILVLSHKKAIQYFCVLKIVDLNNNVPCNLTDN